MLKCHKPFVDRDHLLAGVICQNDIVGDCTNKHGICLSWRDFNKIFRRIASMLKSIARPIDLVTHLAEFASAAKLFIQFYKVIHHMALSRALQERAQDFFGRSGKCHY
ncbi:hypothetical protein XarbCFBP7610_21490 [Xanthomonas arboricola]|nr:hypothetical protein XarbCFBP7610_21490 [Xanthomonas arboricola]